MYLVPVTRKLVWEWDLIIPISVTWSSCMVSWLCTLVPSSPVHARVFAPVASTRSYWILLLPHQVLFAMYGMHQKKWHTFVETTSIILPLCRYKRNSGRHKCSSRRSASEAAPRFGNLCVYEPSALRIYVYESIALWNKPSDLWQVHVQVHVQENIPNVSVIFFWCVLYVQELVYLSLLIWLHSFCWSSVIANSGNEPLALPGMLHQIGELRWRQQLTQAWTSVHSFFYRMQLRKIVSVWRVWEIT